MAAGQSIIVGGVNYGQGSSREHAALVPLYLGVRVVVAKSFARIHVANLINAGILPLTFVNPDDYDKVSQGDELELCGLFEAIVSGKATMTNKTTGESIELCGSFSERQQAMLRAGGLLKYTRNAGNN